MGVKGVCSGCACWVEDHWSYCMHCGTARPVRSSSLVLSASVYSRSASCATATSSKKLRNSKISLGRKRESSKDVRQQLHEWRKRSDFQESVLQKLERRNKLTQRVVATETKNDLRRVIHDGRALVRRWPSCSPLTARSPIAESSRPGNRQQSPSSASSAIACGISTGSQGSAIAKKKGSAGKEEGSDIHSRSVPTALYGRVTGGQEKLYSEHTLSARPHAPDIDPKQGARGKTEPLQNPEGSVHGRKDSARKHPANKRAPAEPRGWFWGAERCTAVGDGSGDDGDMSFSVTTPGKGTMAAFWRGITGVSKNPVHNETVATKSIRPDASSPFSQTSSGKGAMLANTSPEGCHLMAGRNRNRVINGNNKSKTFISVASAKAAVRSASNRGTELLRLMSEGNNPTREECLGKADSAVRAAESAISCANERLFQLELMAAAAAPVSTLPVSGTELTGRGKQPNSVKKQRGFDVSHGTPDGVERDRDNGLSSTSSSIDTSSSLSAHIEQLTEQLELAQSLQAASIAARTRLSRLFEREDAAATPLQALARGFISRRRHKRCKTLATVRIATGKKTKLNERQSIGTRLHLDKDSEDMAAPIDGINTSGSSLSSTLTPSVSSFSRRGHHCQERDVDGGEQEGNTEMKLLPRKEELWWTLAEAESQDKIEENEAILLQAIVKLQALVRSRVARSKTFAAVNQRFAEHFDEEYQHSFYVCNETNSSQWNRPFGFGVERRRDRGAGKRDTVATQGQGVKQMLSEELGKNSRDEGAAAGGDAQHEPSVGRACGSVTGNAAESLLFAAIREVAEEGGRSKSTLLWLVTKLQALVRSRVARSKTFAAINQRFAEHFDEEYQHSFYVCTETNSSQWNRPFGFGVRGVRAALPTKIGVDADDEGNSKTICGGRSTTDRTEVTIAVERTLRDTKREEVAVVVIQSAMRAARARRLLAEKVLKASL